MISAISKYMPRWLMAIIATALVLATMVGSSQDSAEAIDPADTDTVYIADGTNFADALMGATIASLNTSPMLGVAGTNGGDTIPGDTVEELDRLTNDKASPLDTIYIFGGTSAVSANVATQLEAWATNVERIAGDSRWGTYEAISQMLPSAIDEAIHAQEADSATEADNADTLDGNDSSDFLGATEKAADSELLDGKDSTAFLGATQKAADSELLDGLNSSAFLKGSAIAVARVSPGATPSIDRGFGIASVDRPSVGMYCFTLDPSLGVSRDDVVVTASSDISGSTGAFPGFATYRSFPGPCTSDQFGVMMHEFSFDGDGDVSGVQETDSFPFVVVVHDATA